MVLLIWEEVFYQYFRNMTTYKCTFTNRMRFNTSFDQSRYSHNAKVKRSFRLKTSRLRDARTLGRSDALASGRSGFRTLGRPDARTFGRLPSPHFQFLRSSRRGPPSRPQPRTASPRPGRGAGAPAAAAAKIAKNKRKTSVRHGSKRPLFLRCGHVRIARRLAANARRQSLARTGNGSK